MNNPAAVRACKATCAATDMQTAPCLPSLCIYPFLQTSAGCCLSLQAVRGTATLHETGGMIILFDAIFFCRGVCTLDYIAALLELCAEWWWSAADSVAWQPDAGWCEMCACFLCWLLFSDVCKIWSCFSLFSFTLWQENVCVCVCVHRGVGIEMISSKCPHSRWYLALGH